MRAKVVLDERLDREQTSLPWMHLEDPDSSFQ